MHCVQQEQPWWVALGRGTAGGLTLGGHSRPWVSPEEWNAWQQWQYGGGQGDAVDHTLALLGGYPSWLITITQPFYIALRSGRGPEYLDDPAWASRGGGLRWTPLWPWDGVHHRWDGGDPLRFVPPLSGFAPWAAVTTVGMPLAFAHWYAQGDLRDRAALAIPWLKAALAQCLALQAVGAGYFDVARPVEESIDASH